MNILIDAGACRGDFTAAWLKRNPEGKVFCVEPSRSNIEKLRNRFKDQNVEIVEKAIWVSEQTQTLWEGSSSENASITVCSEAQIEHPHGGSIQVEAIKLSNLIKNVVNLKEDMLTLKVDIEGVEFRCLKEMLNENITPSFIYLEDGCRKCLDTKEWKARIEVFNYIIDNELDCRFFVEGDTKSNEDYLECYVPLAAHVPFQIVKNKQGTLEPVIKSLKIAFESFIAQSPDISKSIKSIEFYFSWLTCHLLIVNLDTGESFRRRTIDPLNSTKDTDLVNRFIEKVCFNIGEENQLEVSVNFISLEKCQSYLDESALIAGKKDLL